MKLIINTASTYKGGSVQVANSFINECRKHPENEYHIVLGEALAGVVDQGSFPAHFSFYEIGYRPASRVFSLKPRTRFFENLEAAVAPDVVFTTSGPAYWRPKAPHLAGYNLPHYIYRDSPFFKQILFHQRVKWDAKGKVITYFFKKDSDAYVVQTDDVNRRLKKLLKRDKVFTVSNTCSQYYLNPKEAADKLPERGDGEFRLLTLSAWYPHKNLGIIPEVIDALPEPLKERIRFVLTIPEETFQTKFSRRHRKYILNTGPVPPEEGPGLYKECDALFLPTLLECFSASYAEAMAMERPILTSGLGFARAICGTAALYTNPVDAAETADKIRELAKNPELRERLVSDGKRQLKTFFTAEQRAAAYLNICKKLADEGKN